MSEGFKSLSVLAGFLGVCVFGACFFYMVISYGLPFEATSGGVRLLITFVFALSFLVPFLFVRAIGWVVQVFKNPPQGKDTPPRTGTGA